MDVSVIICSKNRKDNLKAALESLAATALPAERTWEAVIVDNGSNDGTKELVSEYLGRPDLRVKYLLEPRRGKSRALNLGLANAAGGILAFTDDDCVVAPDWIASLLAEFAADASLAGLGGRVELFNPLDSDLATRTSRERKDITRANFDPVFIPIIGCNMAFRREVFAAIGPFNPDVGPGSRWTLGGDDLDLLYRVCRQGYKVAYCPDVLVRHNHGRRSGSQIDLARKRYLNGRGAFYLRCLFDGDAAVLKSAWYEARSLALGAVRGLFRGGAGGDLGVLWAMAKGALAMLEVKTRRGLRFGTEEKP